MTYVMPIIVEQDDDGFYAECPTFQGCYTQGETYEEVLASIRDAVALHIQERQSRGEEIPRPRMVCVTALEVAA
jgi:predicted RNase H-like HicB family nuclease